MTRRTPTDEERITSIREVIEAARGDWHEATALLSIGADLNWLLERASDDERLDVERLADMAVMSLGEVTSVTVYGDIHREFRARFAARVRRAEYERLRR